MNRPVVVHNYPAVPRAAVEEGFAEMSIPEIAVRLRMSRQRCWRVYRSAMTKLVSNPNTLRVLRELARERQRMADERFAANYFEEGSDL